MLYLKSKQTYFIIKCRKYSDPSVQLWLDNNRPRRHGTHLELFVRNLLLRRCVNTAEYDLQIPRQILAHE